MKKFRFVLLDANVVIEIARQGLWEQVAADKIVFRVLGGLNRSDQGISLDEVLGRIGLGRGLGREFTRAYREEWTQKGFQEGITGIGIRRPKR